MPVPDTQKLKLDLKHWLAHIDLIVSKPDTPAIAAGRKLLEAIHSFEKDRRALVVKVLALSSLRLA